jgi:hypothetical protein
MTTVANVEAALKPSRRARRYGRQQADRGKADDRRAKGRIERRGPERLEQVLPAHDARKVGEREEHERQREQIESRAAHFGADGRHVRLAEKPCKQGNRQNKHQRSTDTCSHESTVRKDAHNISGSLRRRAVCVAYGCGGGIQRLR